MAVQSVSHSLPASHAAPPPPPPKPHAEATPKVTPPAPHGTGHKVNIKA